MEAATNNQQAEAGAREKREAIVYIGPTLAGSVHLINNTIFRFGELPQAVKEAADMDENLASLFIPVGNLAKARLAIADPASAEAMAAKAVLGRYRRA